MPEGRQHCILDRILCVGRIPQMSSGLPNECGKLARDCSFQLSQSQIVSTACEVLSFVDYCQCCSHHLYSLKAQRRLFHCKPVSKRSGDITSGCSSRSATNWRGPKCPSHDTPSGRRRIPPTRPSLCMPSSIPCVSETQQSSAFK